ncbi:hypothetical protein MYA_3522 [Burkholderia sp. KJ006]|nr:hypothetical protein MYA_3522 [Burkholderia sp. KJ006]
MKRGSQRHRAVPPPPKRDGWRIARMQRAARKFPPRATSVAPSLFFVFIAFPVRSDRAVTARFRETVSLL